GIVEIVPVIGPLAAGALAIGVGFTASWHTALAAGVCVFAVRMLEDYVVLPKVLGEATGLSPLVVLFSVSAITILFGGLASLLAMPGTRLLEQDRDVALGQLVVFMATATFVLEFWAVWIATESNLSWRALVVAVSLTTAAAQIASSLARRRPSDPEAVGLLGVAAAVFAVLLAI